MATARTSLRDDLLNDPDNDNWSPEVLTRHISVARSRVLGWFIGEGGDILREQATVTSTNGVIDVSAYDIRRVTKLLHVQSNVYYPVGYVRQGEGAVKSTGSESFELIYDAIPAEPALDGDPLVDSDFTFDELEELILLTAARRAAIKDREVPLGLVDLTKELKRECQSHRSVQRLAPPARVESNRFQWTFDRTNNQIQLYMVTK